MGQPPAPRGQRFLYISPNPVESALVRSQVLPYLRGLAALGAEVELLTFERREPRFPEREYPRHLWRGLPIRSGAGIVDKVLDALAALLLALSTVRSRRVAALHARSYLPAAVAWAVRVLTGRPYLFDMRGFLGEEYLDSGYWHRADLRYRALSVAEKVVLRGAAEIVVLTRQAERRLRSEPAYRGHVAGKPITVIPSAVDLERFRPAAIRSPVPTLVYAGSLGTYYRLDDMLNVYAAARARVPALRFLILNQDQQPLARGAIREHGLTGADLVVRGVDFAAVPEALAGAHVGIALILRTPSKLASSAVKVSEYLACGLPVVVNRGLGDIDDEVVEYGAGHVMERDDGGHIDRAADAVVSLLSDEVARVNARRLAVDRYDARTAVLRYARIYERLADARASGAAPQGEEGARR